MKKALVVLVMGVFIAPAFAPMAEAAVDRSAFRAWRMAQMDAQMDIFNNEQLDGMELIVETMEMMEEMPMEMSMEEDMMVEIDPMLAEMMMEDMIMMEEMPEVLMEDEMVMFEMMEERMEEREEKIEDRISVLAEKMEMAEDRTTEVNVLTNMSRRSRVIRRRGKRFRHIDSSSALRSSSTLTSSNTMGEASSALVQAQTLTTNQ